MKSNFLAITLEDGFEVLKGLASPIRISILKTLHENGRQNVNEISAGLHLPQSTVATNVQVLEEAGLIVTETVKAKKGHQKICSARYDEIVIRFEGERPRRTPNLVEVAMPLGLFTSCEVSAPCGLCSTEGIIGLLDVPDSFLDPSRVSAALLWFGRGYVEYKFPNNAKLLNKPVESVEFSMELSSEVPGTNLDWPSDITLWVNEIPDRHLDLARRLRRPAWRLHARLVEAGGLAVRQAQDVADRQERHVHRRRALFRREHRRCRPSQSQFDPATDRHRREGRAPRRVEHLRQGLRQLQPRHYHAAPAAGPAQEVRANRSRRAQFPTKMAELGVDALVKAIRGERSSR